MNIIVLVKQVPDTTDVKLDPKTGNLIREGMTSIINPDDLHAIEAALRLKEAGEGTVTAVTMGPPQAVDALSEAIGMGADTGILLTDRAFAGADTWATSYALGMAIQKIGEYDLILCGRQAIDGDTAQIGPQVAEFLGLPQVSYVFDIKAVHGNKMVVKRRLEEGYEKIQCALPALLTVTGELNRPRYPVVGRMIDACREKAPVKLWNAADIRVRTLDVGLDGSLTNVINTFSPKGRRQGKILKGDPKEVVQELVRGLTENNVFSV